MDVEVTKEDREAAANLYLDLEGPPYSPKDLAESTRHKTGEYDAHPAIQAFARHRLATIAQRDAQIVAWLREGLPGPVPMLHLETVADAIKQGLPDIARSIEARRAG